MAMAKHRNLWSVAAYNLWRYRPRTIAVLLPLLVVMGTAASVTFVRDGLSRDAALSTGMLPDITVQRLIGGRIDRIPLAYADSLRGIGHVVDAVPRVWGYVPVSVPGGEVAYTLMGIDPERMPLPEEVGLTVEAGRFLAPGDVEGAVVGNAFASVFDLDVGDRITLEDALGNEAELQIVGIFGTAVEIYAADLLVVTVETAREFFGYRDDEASDLCVYLDDEIYADLTAQRIVEVGDNLRVMTRDALAELTQQAYGGRGGVFQLMWMILLLTACLVAWAQGASIGLAMRREVGILKAIGWGTLDIIEVKMLETVIVALIGTFGGILIGLGYLGLGAPGIKQYFLGWATVYPEFAVPVYMSLKSLFLLLVVGIFPLLVATVVPAWLVGIIEPDEAIRGEQ